MEINNIDINKLPQIYVDYNQLNLILKHIPIPKFPSGYDVYMDYVSGDLGLITLSGQLHADEFLFDYTILGINLTDIVILVEPNPIKNFIKRNKIYIKSFLRDFNLRILYIFEIWGLCEREMGAYPMWRDVYIIRKIYEFFRKFYKS